MNQPKTMHRGGADRSPADLALAYALASMAVIFVFDVHWVYGMAVAPLVMLAMLAAIALFVQLLWMLVLGMERVGQLVGLRKSPLS